jgi:hypothetical protein
VSGRGDAFVLERTQEGGRPTSPGRLTGDVFPCWQRSNPTRGEATVDGDEMKGQPSRRP